MKNMMPRCGGNCNRDSGDANADGAVDIADSIFLLAFLFAHGPAPEQPITACE